MNALLAGGTQLVVLLDSYGAGSWALFIAVDVVLGIVLRTRGNGHFDAAQIQSFLSSNLGTKEVGVMLGLIGTAVVSALSAHVLSGGDQALTGTLHVIESAALTTLAGGIASQDLALLKDIAYKLAGQTPGQLARAKKAA